MNRIYRTARIALSAFVAPVIPAVLVLIWLLLFDPAWAWWGFGVFTIPGYMAMLFIGAPLLWLMQRKGWSLNAWRCIAAGAFCGAVLVFPMKALDLFFGAGSFSNNLGWFGFYIFVSAIGGALAGLAFRVIAGSSISATRNDSMPG